MLASIDTDAKNGGFVAIHISCFDIHVGENGTERLRRSRGILGLPRGRRHENLRPVRIIGRFSWKSIQFIEAKGPRMLKSSIFECPVKNRDVDERDSCVF